MEVSITNEDRAKRSLSVSPNSHDDYLYEGFRRIFPGGGEMLLENCLFEDPVSIYLKDKTLSISILNCEFRHDLHIHRGDKEVNYHLFIYKSEIRKSLFANTFDSRNKISIDTSYVHHVSFTGKADKIDLFGSQIDALTMENLKCGLCRIERSFIDQYALDNFNTNEAEFDTDNLAINGYSRFIAGQNQTRKQVSEIYHRFVLKGAKSLKATSEINYQLMKATTNWTGVFFGYFFKPFYVVLWIIAIIVAFSFIYWSLFNIAYNQSLYFSVCTFLTIGFEDMDSSTSFLKTGLVFTEGLLGIMYVAVLLTSVINASKKS